MPVVELVRDEARLEALAPAWARLWQRSDASPFLHPAWLLPWWRRFGTGAPRVALLHAADDSLAGILLLYELPGEGKILPFGVGLSDYLDAVLDPAAAPEAASLLLRTALHEASLPCHIPDLPPQARLGEAAPPSGWRLQVRPGACCPVLSPLSVPSRQQRKLRMARHRAERAGGYTEIGIGDLSLAELFGHLQRLHTDAWRERGEAGVLASPQVRAFHAEALPLLHASGLLALSALRIGSTIAAVTYALQRPGELYLYLSGFDPAFRYESPGSILLGTIIERACAADTNAIHFLRGSETYKYAWGAVDRRSRMLILEPA